MTSNCKRVQPESIYRGPDYIWLLPPSLVRKLDRRQTGILKKTHKWLTGEGGMKGVGEEPNHTPARKPGPQYIIQYSQVLVVFGLACAPVHSAQPSF